MKAIEKEKLWEEYQKNPTPKLREQLKIEYAQLVRLVAGRLSMYLGHNVEYDDEFSVCNIHFVAFLGFYVWQR